MLTKVVLHIHIMGELDELPDGADVAPICSAVQRSELPLIPHIHLKRTAAFPSSSCWQHLAESNPPRTDVQGACGKKHIVLHCAGCGTDMRCRSPCPHAQGGILE